MIFHPIKYYQNQDHYYWLCHQIITCLIFDISFFSFSVSSHFYITNMGSFIKRQTSGTTSDNEWQRVVQRVTTNDNEWQWVVQQVPTTDNKWHREWQQVTTGDIEWQEVQRVVILAKLPFLNNMVLVWADLHFITP